MLEFLQKDFVCKQDDPHKTQIDELIQSVSWKTVRGFKAAFGDGADKTVIYSLPTKAIELFNVMRRITQGVEDEQIAELNHVNGFEHILRVSYVLALLAPVVKMWDESDPLAKTQRDKENQQPDPQDQADPPEDRPEEIVDVEAEKEAQRVKYSGWAEDEMDAFFYGIASTGNAETDFENLRNARAVSAEVPTNKVRFWVVEGGQHEEKQEKFGKSNPFFSSKSGAIPQLPEEVLDCWVQLLKQVVNADEARNVLWFATNGVYANQKALPKIIKKVGRLSEPVLWSLIAGQEDIQSRKEFKYNPEDKRGTGKKQK